MTTTLVRDSIVGDDWLRSTAAAVPIQAVMKDGVPTGDYLTGPVRLAFDDLFELPKPRPGATSEPKYGANLLFTPLADFALLYEAYYKICAQMFPEYYDAGTQQYHGLQSPFSNQADKLKWGGFTPGCVALSVKSKFKPSVVDRNFNPIVDRSKVYAGVWAICAINAYGYGKNPPQPKKGVAFGLQSVMIIGDDKKFGQAAPDAKTQFGGVSVAPPVVRPDIASGMSGMGNAAPAPAAGIPGYTAPGGGAIAPASGQPHIPQTHFHLPPQGETEEEREMREMGLA